MSIPPRYKKGYVKQQAVPGYCAVTSHGAFRWGTFARTQGEALELAKERITGKSAPFTIVKCTLAIYPEPYHERERDYDGGD